jgi:hypothetical protein
VRAETERDNFIDLLPNKINVPIIKKKIVNKKPNRSKRK